MNSGDVHAVFVCVPNDNEQSAIAAILSEMEAEVAALEMRPTKALQIKHAMIQELLSGRARLI